MESQVAVIKPSGLQVLPGGLFQQRTVLTQLQWREWRVTTSSPLCTKQRASQAHPVPVHRLGRGTSGLFELQISDLMDSVLCKPSVRFRLGAPILIWFNLTHRIGGPSYRLDIRVLKSSYAYNCACYQIEVIMHGQLSG